MKARLCHKYVVPDSSLKSNIYKLGIGKLETTPVDLNQLSDLVKNEVVKKTLYDELVKKVNAIQTTDTKISEVEKKIL